MDHEKNQAQATKPAPTDANLLVTRADESKQAERVRRGLPFVGFCFSGAYLIFLALMVVAAWDNLWAMDPNEFGDMMAGVFAPLAFLWLVLGFFQHGQELKASVKALELQGEELRNSVAQQRELVAVTREQLESEIAAANERRAAEEFAAQPVFIPCTGAAYSAEGGARYEIGFTNAGAKATNVTIRGPEGAICGKELVANGERILTYISFKDRKKMESFSGFVEYYDARGNRRARAFTYPLLPDGDDGEKNSLGAARVQDELYSPPLPWDPR